MSKDSAPAVTAIAPPLSLAQSSDYLELTKPRITVLVLATTLVGFYLAATSMALHALLMHTLLGTALVAGGASALNMYFERNLDARMRRTLRRPLPAGRLRPNAALTFALMISASGIVYLFFLVNGLTSLLSAATLLSYLFLYTPLKTRTWLCTIIGAAPGALPIVMGWAAAKNDLSVTAWVLFAILFLWQIPHFYAIGWMYREDYARAGFPMLPVVDPSGARTGRQSSIYIFILMLASILPFTLGVEGRIYLTGALVGGIVFQIHGLRFAWKRDRASARNLFFVSIWYLPILLSLLMADKI